MPSKMFAGIAIPLHIRDMMHIALNGHARKKIKETLSSPV
jgi:hypothetical protein